MEFNIDSSFKRFPINSKGYNESVAKYCYVYIPYKDMTVAEISYNLYKSYIYEDYIYYINRINGIVKEGDSILVVNPKYLKNFELNYKNGFGFKRWFE